MVWMNFNGSKHTWFLLHCASNVQLEWITHSWHLYVCWLSLECVHVVFSGYMAENIKFSANTRSGYQMFMNIQLCKYPISKSVRQRPSRRYRDANLIKGYHIPLAKDMYYDDRRVQHRNENSLKGPFVAKMLTCQNKNKPIRIEGVFVKHEPLSSGFGR